MAGDWIKMRMDLPEDPAVYRLARLTGLDRLSVVGRLYAFWAWADKHAVDGRVDGGASTDVDDVVRHEGFAEAMAQVKWLEIAPDYLAIPKHDRHNGESAKERSLKNQRQARWRDKKDGDGDGDVGKAASTRPSTKASTREEKRREEEKTGHSDAPASGDADPIFGDGLAYLVQCGVPERSGRSFLGKMRSVLKNDLLVTELLAKARQQEVSDPLAWLRAAAGRKTATGRTETGVAL